MANSLIKIVATDRASMKNGYSIGVREKPHTQSVDMKIFRLLSLFKSFCTNSLFSLRRYEVFGAVIFWTTSALLFALTRRIMYKQCGHFDSVFTSEKKG